MKRTQQQLPRCPEQRKEHFKRQIAQVFSDEVCQISIFGMRPDVFHWIEFGRVEQQPLELNPSTESLQQFSNRASMRAESIRHHDHASPDLLTGRGNGFFDVLPLGFRTLP